METFSDPGERSNSMESLAQTLPRLSPQHFANDRVLDATNLQRKGGFPLTVQREDCSSRGKGNSCQGCNMSSIGVCSNCLDRIIPPEPD